jgi:hypothetical protein
MRFLELDSNPVAVLLLVGSGGCECASCRFSPFAGHVATRLRPPGIHRQYVRAAEVSSRGAEAAAPVVRQSAARFLERERPV